MASATKNPIKFSQFSPGRNEMTAASKWQEAPARGIAMMSAIREKKVLTAPSLSPPIKLKKRTKAAIMSTHIIILLKSVCCPTLAGLVALRLLYWAPGNEDGAYPFKWPATDNAGQGQRNPALFLPFAFKILNNLLAVKLNH